MEGDAIGDVWPKTVVQTWLAERAGTPPT